MNKPVFLIIVADLALVAWAVVEIVKHWPL